MIDEAVEAIRAGDVVVLPTDTVYGLATTPHRAEPVRRLYRLKGRDARQPTAIVAYDLDVLLACIPELRGRAGAIAGALLPGPYTLVLPNPGRRYLWLAGPRPDAIGVRVPALDGPGADVLRCVGAVAATSANLPGGPDPARLESVPESLRAACAAVVDGGELPGTPSTVIDFAGESPVVLREGRAPAAEALERVRAVVG